MDFKNRFNSLTRESFEKLFQIAVLFSSFRLVGSDVHIDVVCCSAYRTTLILKNAEGIPGYKYDVIDFSEGELIFGDDKDDKITLTGTVMDYVKDEILPFKITFIDADVNVDITNGTPEPVNENPFVALQSAAEDILDKYELSKNLLNEKETALLPLAAELVSSSYFAVIPEKLKVKEFELLKTLAEKHNKVKLVRILNDLANSEGNGKKSSAMSDKLCRIMNRADSEPMWREIFDAFADSQATYQNSAELYYTKDELDPIRDRITELFYAAGYTGSYPTFEKRGEIGKVRVTASYGKTYFVSHEKNAHFIIHCLEERFNEHLMIKFACGTRLYRKGENEGDIYSCTFDGNGRRYFELVTYEKEYIKEDGSVSSDDLDLRVACAVKKAELCRLTKVEKEELQNFTVPKALILSLFLFVFVLMGGLFGILMCAGFALLEVLAAVVTGSAAEIGSLLISTPWWLIFLFCAAGFGGVMGIVTLIAYSK